MQPAGRFDPAVISNDPDRRPLLIELLEAGLEALDPGRAVREALLRRGDDLRLGATSIDLDTVPRVIVLALGKAAPAMAAALEGLLGDQTVGGVVVAPDQAVALDRLAVVPGDHPIPGSQSIDAGRLLLETASSATAHDLVVFLISGGGSAMAEVLPPGVDLGDLARLNAELLAAGAPIEEVNTVRRHLSLIKGGRLATAAGDACIMTLVASDVVGDRPEVVASGPSLADGTGPADALAILDHYELEAGASIDTHLRREAPPAAASRHEVAVIVNGATGAEGVRRAAPVQELTARVVTTALTGEARDAAATIAASINAEKAPALLIFAGETTVTVTGDGIGGRNQELALAASLHLDNKADVVVAALGTDGVDGNTNAGGAVVDGATASRVRGAGLDPEASLANNDSHTALAAAGELLRCGPTGTNAGDLTLAYRSA